MAIPPGWYHASGDAWGTVRYWDGGQWVGEPVVAPPVSQPPPRSSGRLDTGHVAPGRSWFGRMWIPTGRVNRTTYFLFSLISIAIPAAMWAVAITGSIIDVAAGTYDDDGGVLSGVLVLVFALSVLFFVWPSIATAVKRIHDVGLSGWFYLLNLAPVVGWVFWLYCFFAPGHPGPNAHGNQPGPGFSL